MIFPDGILQDYFVRAKRLASGEFPAAPRPYRTFASSDTAAFHLAYSPHISKISVDEAAEKFAIPDLRAALADHLQRLAEKDGGPHFVGGRRNVSAAQSLPFEFLHIWIKARIQTKAFHNPREVLPPQTINASPPSRPDWPHGRSDAALVNVDFSKKWPYSGFEGMLTLSVNVLSLTTSCLAGHFIGQIRVIMQPILRRGSAPITGLSPFLAYVERLDVVPQADAHGRANAQRMQRPDPVTQMYVLKRAVRSDGSRMGGVVPLSQLRAPVDLIPRFGPVADKRLAKNNCLEYSSEVFLNRYSDKEMFYALVLGGR